MRRETLTLSGRAHAGGSGTSMPPWMFAEKVHRHGLLTRDAGQTGGGRPVCSASRRTIEPGAPGRERRDASAGTRTPGRVPTPLHAWRAARAHVALPVIVLHERWPDVMSSRSWATSTRRSCCWRRGVRGKNLVNDWRPLAGVHIQLLRLPLKLPEVVEHE